MQKIHITITDGIPPETALECVKHVVKEGRISNRGKSYSYASAFTSPLGKIWVETMQYRKSDCFKVFLDKN